MIGHTAAYLLSSEGGRPFPVKQPPLPPFDHSDPGGDIHTTMVQTPPPNPTKDWWRGDFGGVTLKSAPPYVDGANTTPPEMTMSFFLPKYNRDWQDIILTAHAERSYSHFHLDWYTAQAVGMSPTQFINLVAYVRSWGFYPSFWGLSSLFGHFGSWNDAKPILSPLLTALDGAGRLGESSILILGEELNSCTTPAGLLSIVQAITPHCATLGLDIWLHFTSNYPAWPLPGQSQQQFWAEMIGLGVKGLCWQSNAFDLAGTMGGHMWDSRKVIPPPGRLVAFETRAFAQLVDPTLIYTEGVGCLTGYELICCPIAPGTNILPVSGFGNGGRYPDGSPI